MPNKFIITPQGQIRFIYADEFRDILKSGKSQTVRVSHVEPVGDEWEADLSLVGGPKLGPYPTRKKALEAEIKWLNKHLSQIQIPKAKSNRSGSTGSD